MSDAAGSDSKLVTRAAEKVKGQLAIWCVAGLCSVVTGLVAAAWHDMGRRIDKLESLIDTRASTIDAQRKADIAGLQQAFANYLDEMKPLRDRLTATELTALRNREWIDRNAERIGQIAADLAEIRSRLRPAPPVDLGRVPMLWRF